MATNVRWGILGTGRIAKQFAADLSHVANSEIKAVGSRAIDTAKSFGDLYDIPNRYDSYQALVDDPDVDVIYVSTPHNLHYENCMQALRAGKHVLCEKAFTVNRRQAEEVINLARDSKLFIMEAMWTRFFPATHRIIELIDSGEIGEVRQIDAHFGFNKEYDPESRLYAPELAGGALLDVGVYVIWAAHFIYKQVPDKITATTHKAQTGVDGQTRMLFEYNDGRASMLSCAVSLQTRQDVFIAGTKGSIRVHRHFWHPDSFTVTYNDSANTPERTETHPITASGMNYEAEECVKCIRAGKTESDLLPLQHTLDVMGIMDACREQWGFVYPGEHDRL